jgi:hypothetical protein
MKLTLEHALILILTIAVIYYVVQHRNLLTDLFRIPDRGHPELKVVKDKHTLEGKRCYGQGIKTTPIGPVSDIPINKEQKMTLTTALPGGRNFDVTLPYKRTGRNAADPKNDCSQILFYNLDNVFYKTKGETEEWRKSMIEDGCKAFCAKNDWWSKDNECKTGAIRRTGNKIYQATCQKGKDCPYGGHGCREI